MSDCNDDTQRQVRTDFNDGTFKGGKRVISTAILVEAGKE